MKVFQARVRYPFNPKKKPRGNHLDMVFYTGAKPMNGEPPPDYKEYRLMADPGSERAAMFATLTTGDVPVYLVEVRLTKPDVRVHYDFAEFDEALSLLVFGAGLEDIIQRRLIEPTEALVRALESSDTLVDVFAAHPELLLHLSNKLHAQI